MSNQKSNGSSDQHHERSAEMHNGAAHAHAVSAESHEKQDHQTGHERSRQALEHKDHSDHYAANGNHETGSAHEDVAILAHGLWEARGCPDGTPDEDWFLAADQLQIRGEAVAN